jgi:hypothetical protein
MTMTWNRARVAAAVAVAVICGAAVAPVSAQAGSLHQPARYRQIALIKIPVSGGPLVGDIIFADQASGRVYFSDDSNSAVDVIDGRHNRLLTQVTGFVNGPNGVLSDGRGRIWAADGNRTVQVIEARPPFRRLAAVNVGGQADELAFDPVHDVIAVTSPDASRPYVSLISARPGRKGRYRVLGRVLIPGAPASSLEQPQWDPDLRAFVESVRRTRTLPGGALVVIDPVRSRLVRMISLKACNPAGLAIGPDDQALAGCSSSGPLIVNPETGRVLVHYPHRTHCCADEVWFDRRDGRYLVAESGSEGPPPAPQLKPPAVLVIDAKSLRVLATIELGNSAGPFHQVTALGRNGEVFVPEGDGIHVFKAG